MPDPQEVPCSLRSEAGGAREGAPPGLADAHQCAGCAAERERPDEVDVVHRIERTQHGLGGSGFGDGGAGAVDGGDGGG